jgi:hypothetical protein
MALKHFMRYLVVFFFFIATTITVAQTTETVDQVFGTIVNDNDSQPVSNVNIVNLNRARGAVSDDKGKFIIDATVNDTLYISCIGFQSIRIRVTNDWIKNKTTKIHLTEKAIALEEIVIGTYYLTGYLEVDSKLIPIRENYRYSISGLQQGYEVGQYSPGAFNKVMSSIFNPADMLYNFFGNKPGELKKLKEMKKDDNIRTLLESKYDREMIAVLLGIKKEDIPEILQHCNYSESFIKTANDLQVMDAISECYEQYRILKKK